MSWMNIIGNKNKKIAQNSKGSIITENQKYFPHTDLLFDDSFDDGFEGWVELMDIATPKAPLSLTSYPVMSGRHALKLSTANTQDAGIHGHCTALKRLTRAKEGILYFDLWFSWGSAYPPNTPRVLQFGIDTQTTTDRNFWKWRFVNFDEATNTRVRKWVVSSGTADTYIDIPGASGASVDVPYNENKQNYCYVKFGLDMVKNRYHSFQIYDQVFDLTTLGAPPTDYFTNLFDHGLNFIVDIYNRNSTPNSQAWMTIDRARGWIE